MIDVQALSGFAMYDTAAASRWNTEYAFNVARRIASLNGVYCGPAAIAWIAAIWNAGAGKPYDYVERLNNKKLFANGPRSLASHVPGFPGNLDALLQRETHGALALSTERYFRYTTIHDRIRTGELPLVVRIPSASLRDGLHYVVLFKSIHTDHTFRFFWQDNGVFKSQEFIQPGISLSVHSAKQFPFFAWGARQVVVNSI